MPVCLKQGLSGVASREVRRIFSDIIPQVQHNLVSAGGYDAIWLLVCDPVDCTPDQRPVERVERIWSNYKDLDVSPLSAVESLAKGARAENLEDIKGLKIAISK